MKNNRNPIFIFVLTVFSMILNGCERSSNSDEPNSSADLIPTVIEQPDNTISVSGLSTELCIQLNGEPPYTARIQRLVSPNWIDISNDTVLNNNELTCITTPVLNLTDDGAQLRVFVANSSGEAVSNTITTRVVDIVYENGFDDNLTTAADVTASLEISPADTAQPESGQEFVGLGNTGNLFEGNLFRAPGGTSVTLNLSNLPPHNRISVEFLFAAIDSWDGDGTSYPNGDYFKISVDGNQVFRESFENATGTVTQSYIPSAGVELARRIDLGFAGPGSFFTDSAYDFSLEPQLQTIAHSNSTLAITFILEGPGANQPIDDESWGIDNLKIRLLP